MEEYTIYAGNIVYATRSTYDEALKVVEEQLNLIEKFGKPKIVQTVVPLRHSDNSSK